MLDELRQFCTLAFGVRALLWVPEPQLHPHPHVEDHLFELLLR